MMKKLTHMENYKNVLYKDHRCARIAIVMMRLRF